MRRRIAFAGALCLALGLCPPVAQAQPGSISLDVQNADVVDVLRLLALESGANIAVDRSVKPERATIHLRNVSFATALRVVTEAFDLAIRHDGSVLMVAARDGGHVATDATVPGIRTVSVPLRYARADDAERQLSGVVPKNAFRADLRQNAILVTGDAATIGAARAFLAVLDVPTPQVMFEVKVVDVTLANDNANVGVLFGGSAGTVGSTTYTFQNRTIPIQATLNALISANRAKVLATPRVATLNNQAADLRIGTSYPIVSTTSTGTTALQSVSFVDIGVNLKLTPTIGSDGSIIAELHPQYSVLQGLSPQGYPIIANRQVDSTLRVRSDETIVLGGLFEEITSETVTKVPLLGDIPILGQVFRNRQRLHQKDDIVFLITPHVL